MSVTLQPVSSIEMRKQFVLFPFELYKGHPHWVPPIIADEMETFDPQVNPVFQHAKADLFLAKKGDKIVGRIAILRNLQEIERLGIPKIRFGWYDVEDDVEISRALINQVLKIAKDEGLSQIEGPVGFSNLDKAGLLVKGFDHRSTMVTWYNFPYYKDHLEQLGFEQSAEWVEYKIKAPVTVPEKLKKFSALIRSRYGLRLVKITSKKDLTKVTDELFQLIDDSYSVLPTYIPISEDQKIYYRKKFINFMHLDYLIFIKNEKDELVAFAITMPSYAKALQKTKGKLWPFGFLHLLKSRYFNDTVEFYLIGIHPDLQKKGITSIIFEEMARIFLAKGITKLETNPELSDNKAIQALWKSYEHVQHKTRCTYSKTLDLT